MNKALLKTALEKHPRAEKLQFTADDIRWATPEIVAQYRAQRLACNTIVDIGCGIGFQSFAFATTCKKVYAIDIDKEKIKRAENNAKFLGLRNITFIQGDALDPAIIKKLKEVDIVFCDPERLAGEDQRSVTTIQPNIPKLLELYSPLTKDIAIEFPPQIKSIPFDCEQEYLSLDGQLNRLTLYFGKLQQAARSAVILPQGAVLKSTSAASTKPKETKKIAKYLYEVDLAVVKAELLAELSPQTTAALFSRGKATYYTSSKLIESPFFKNSFQILGQCTFAEKEIITLLKEHHVKEVVLRYSVDPQDYWASRTRFEKVLTGTKKVYLFKFGSEAVIAEKS